MPTQDTPLSEKEAEISGGGTDSGENYEIVSLSAMDTDTVYASDGSKMSAESILGNLITHCRNNVPNLYPAVSEARDAFLSGGTLSLKISAKSYQEVFDNKEMLEDALKALGAAVKILLVKENTEAAALNKEAERIKKLFGIVDFKIVR